MASLPMLKSEGKNFALPITLEATFVLFSNVTCGAIAICKQIVKKSVFEKFLSEIQLTFSINEIKSN